MRLLERGRSAGQGAVAGLELLFQVEQLAADLAGLLPQLFEGLLLVLCQRPGTEQLVDPLVDRLTPAEQGDLAVAFLVVERSRRSSGHLVGDPAGQASFPARPGLARLPGAGQGGGEAGERGAYAERRLEARSAPETTPARSSPRPDARSGAPHRAFPEAREKSARLQ